MKEEGLNEKDLLIAVKFNKENKSEDGIKKSLSDLGRFYYAKQDYEKGILTWRELVLFVKGTDDQELYGNSLGNLGLLYRKTGSFDLAFKYIYEGIEVLKGLVLNDKVKLSISNMYNNIGSVYIELKKFDEALKVHFISLKYRKELKREFDLAQSYNNIGQCYLESGDLDNANTYLMTALELKQKLGSNKLLGSTYSLLGQLFHLRKENKKAEKYFALCLENRKAYNNHLGYAGILERLGAFLISQKKYQKAESYLLECNEFSKENNLKEIRILALNSLKNLYKETGDFEAAIKYFEEYDVIKERLRGEMVISKMSEMQTLHETQELERKLILEESDKLKTQVLMKELHHRVYNNLVVILGLIRVQKETLTDAAAIKALKKSEERIRAMVSIHQRLYGENVDVIGVNMDLYIDEIAESLSTAYGLSEIIELEFDVEPDLILPVNIAMPVCLIINEIISNAYKHAFAEQENPVLAISLKFQAKQKLRLRITDNGQGIDDLEKIQNSQSFGIKLIHTFCEQMDANLEFLHNESGGTVFNLDFDLD